MKLQSLMQKYLIINEGINLLQAVHDTWVTHNQV